MSLLNNRPYNHPFRKIARSNNYDYKIHLLYKYCAEGWSIELSENKAGLYKKTNAYDTYKESEHFQRIRTMYAKKEKSC